MKIEHRYYENEKFPSLEIIVWIPSLQTTNFYSEKQVVDRVIYFQGLVDEVKTCFFSTDLEKDTRILKYINSLINEKINVEQKLSTIELILRISFDELLWKDLKATNKQERYNTELRVEYAMNALLQQYFYANDSKLKDVFKQLPFKNIKIVNSVRIPANHYNSDYGCYDYMLYSPSHFLEETNNINVSKFLKVSLCTSLLL